ncbi:hypothetical protein L0U85_04810 [Glycomyces sp. L485]|uniref:hypothetical protein n=1 Tax=Glycomyces sp. L485 TaxID=2909235 RepID=UPI001F4A0CCE|nr:hypothetical protein [Glycomyces sp. L485]MCH7230186.1 hypothetical protein [Glycomyces sp. L485]
MVFLLLPFELACAFVGVQLAVFGLYMGTSFAPNHKNMPVVRRNSKVPAAMTARGAIATAC